LLPQTVVNALHIPEASARAPMTVRTERLRHQEMLLVVDGCEHVPETSAVLIDVVLRAAAGLRVLATSRQALGAPGEALFAARPVPEPEAVLAPGPPSSTRHALFAARASTVVQEFAITTDNQTAVCVTRAAS
jgi:non-specific serine/threonine protein kinase